MDELKYLSRQFLEIFPPCTSENSLVFYLAADKVKHLYTQRGNSYQIELFDWYSQLDSSLESYNCLFRQFYFGKNQNNKHIIERKWMRESEISKKWILEMVTRVKNRYITFWNEIIFFEMFRTAAIFPPNLKLRQNREMAGVKADCRKSEPA